MVKASQATFSIGFNKYKLIDKSCFPDIDVKSIHADPWDESMIIIVGDATRLIIETTKKYALQTDVTR